MWEIKSVGLKLIIEQPFHRFKIQISYLSQYVDATMIVHARNKGSVKRNLKSGTWWSHISFMKIQARQVKKWKAQITAF